MNGVVRAVLGERVFDGGDEICRADKRGDPL